MRWKEPLRNAQIPSTSLASEQDSGVSRFGFRSDLLEFRLIGRPGFVVLEVPKPDKEQACILLETV
jgi:hypothetical protein